MKKQNIRSEIKKILGETHFGVSPDSDQYVEQIFIEDENNNRKQYKNSSDLIKNIINDKISLEEITIDTVSVLFSESLFTDVEKEYKQYAV